MPPANGTPLKRAALVVLVLLLVLGAAIAIRQARRSTAAATPAAEAGSSQSTVAPGVPLDATNTTGPGAATSFPANPPASMQVSPSPFANPGATKPSPAATPVGPPDEAAMLEIDSVNLMIRDYRTLAGENPVGTNAEIMSAIMGDNPKQAKFGPPEGAKLNEKGELLDRWGTPYFFHQLSRDHMEIRSAGPDKILWNADDPVIR